MIGTSSTRPISKNIGSPIRAPTRAIAQGSVRALDRSTIVSTISAAPPESASSLPNIAPSAMSTPTEATVAPTPAEKLSTVLDSSAPATAPVRIEPMVRARNGCTLSQVISTTITAMPISAAATSWPPLASVIGSAVRNAVFTRASGGGEGRDEVVDDLLDRVGQVRGDAGLVVLERLEGLELGGEHLDLEEVLGALAHALGDDVRVAGQVQEPHPGGEAAQRVPVGAVQGRAADHPAAVVVLGQPAADRRQPGGPVVVVQRVAGGHLVDVGLRVEHVGVPVVHAQASASASPTVVFPEPETPMTTASGRSCAAASMVAPRLDVPIDGPHRGADR